MRFPGVVIINLSFREPETEITSYINVILILSFKIIYPWWVLCKIWLMQILKKMY